MLSDLVRVTDGLLPAWRQALTHEHGSLLVLGAAGAGKTTLIGARFCRLVDEGEAPERLLVIAPTPGRALALRAKLEAELRQGYDTLHCLTPTGVARALLEGALEQVAGPHELTLPTVGRGDRVAMLVERIDELPLAHHDIGGNSAALIGGFIRRIDRLKAEGIRAEAYGQWARGLGDERLDADAEREFAEIYRVHEQMLGRTRDDGALVLDAFALVERRPELRTRFAHVLIDDAHELDLAPARLLLALADGRLTAAADPAQTLRRFRGAGQATVADARGRAGDRPLTHPLRALSARRAHGGPGRAAGGAGRYRPRRRGGGLLALRRRTHAGPVVAAESSG